MNRRGTGTIFCCISAFLFSTKYVCAAIFGSSVSSWDRSLFLSLLDFVGNTLLILSVLSLIVGIVYLVWAEKELKVKPKGEDS